MINLIDGYFMGNYIGKEGLAAVNLGLPIVYLYLAVGLMFAVGGVAIAGRLIGANEIDKANKVFRQTMAMCLMVTLGITVCMCVFLNPVSVEKGADLLEWEKEEVIKTVGGKSENFAISLKFI